MAPPDKHVMSIFAQYAPYRLNRGWTDARREAFGSGTHPEGGVMGAPGRNAAMTIRDG